MATLKEICDEIDFISDRMSSQVRTICIGILALAWGLLLGESAVAREVAAHLKWNLLRLGFLGILVLLFDYLQYFIGYFDANQVRKRAEASADKTATYRYDSAMHELRRLFFWAKQTGALALCGYFLGVIGYYLLKRP